MDKLLKSFTKLWHFKERFVLLVVLGFLSYNIYQIFVPKKMEIQESPRAGTVPQPKEPFGIAVDAPTSHEDLVRRNPFSYWSDAEDDSGEGLTAQQIGIELLRVQDLGGRLRARLKTPSSAGKWYDEGENFEQFKLEKINLAEQTVVVFSDSHGRTVTIGLQR